MSTPGRHAEGQLFGHHDPAGTGRETEARIFCRFPHLNAMAIRWNIRKPKLIGAT